MLVDPGSLDAKALYRLMISVVVPRPIAWTSTIGADGVPNAAPFSYFQALSSRPPMVMIAVGARRGGTAKDTRRNIEATREFVVNVVSEASAVPMVRSSIDYPPGVSEFHEVGLTPLPSVRVKPPRIGESAVSLECRLDRVLDVGASGVCIGEVLLLHVRDDVLAPDGTVDPWKLRPLGRLGGTAYAPLREVVEITTDGEARTAESELWDLWRELRRRTLDLVGRLEPGQLATVARLLLDGRGEPGRLREELERAGLEFERAARVFAPDARKGLLEAIRREAFCHGAVEAGGAQETG